ncbi:RDD family protein [Flavobacterium humidisoli]
MAALLLPHLPDYFNNRFHLVFMTVWVIYFFLMEVLFKTTLGKRMMSIKTVSDNKEEPVTIVRYFLRSLVKCIPMINIILLFNKNHKGLHDYIASTVVIER